MKNQGNSGRAEPCTAVFFAPKDALQSFPALLTWSYRLYENPLIGHWRPGGLCKTSPPYWPAVRVICPDRTGRHMGNERQLPLLSISAYTGVPHPETQANFTESWPARQQDGKSFHVLSFPIPL